MIHMSTILHSTYLGRRAAHRMGMPPQQASPPGDASQWPYHSFLPLAALPGAIPCARLHTTAVLWEWGMDALAQAAELAVSALATTSPPPSPPSRAPPP